METILDSIKTTEEKRDYSKVQVSFSKYEKRDIRTGQVQSLLTAVKQLSNSS